MKKAIACFLVAITVLLLSTSLGLAVIHITDFPYRFDISYLKISEKSGFSRAVILQNYDAIIDYLSPFSEKEFSLPTMAYTARASFHFTEVKAVFNYIYILGAASALILAIMTAAKSVSKKTLRISGAVTLAFPVIIASAALIDFERTFDIFHELFFNGATWIFDPQTDEFISILPSEFFLHCGLFITLFLLAAALFQLKIGYYKKKAGKS